MTEGRRVNTTNSIKHPTKMITLNINWHYEKHLRHFYVKNNEKFHIKFMSMIGFPSNVCTLYLISPKNFDFNQSKSLYWYGYVLIVLYQFNDTVF